MSDTGPFIIIGASPMDLRHEAEGLDDLLAGVTWALNRGHLSLNPTIHAAARQITMRMELLRNLALDMDKPISGAVS